MRGQAISEVSGTVHTRITPADAGTRVPSSCFLPDCGDKFPSASPAFWFLGSPPRMRGQAPKVLSCDGDIRITPADAGTRRPETDGIQRREDHPRGCGDKKSSCQLEHPTYGSPPRMRGKVAPVEKLVTASGITPADAGTSLFPLYCGRYSADHPRGCGDKTTNL